jgi:hypothetical protein
MVVIGNRYSVKPAVVPRISEEKTKLIYENSSSIKPAVVPRISEGQLN